MRNAREQTAEDEYPRADQRDRRMAVVRAQLAQAKARLCPHGVPRGNCVDCRQPTKERE